MKNMKITWVKPSHLIQHTLVLSRGYGIHLVDAEGNEFLDCFGGILAVGVGHCYPKVTRALTKRMERGMNTSTRYSNEPPLRLAKKLAEFTPGNLQKFI